MKSQNTPFPSVSLSLEPYFFVCCRTVGRDDLLGECVDKVEIGFDAYLQSTNGNPLTYDTVRAARGFSKFRHLVCRETTWYAYRELNPGQGLAILRHEKKLERWP